MTDKNNSDNNLLNRADEILHWLNQSFLDSDQDGDTDNEENDELGKMVQVLVANQDPEQCVSTNNQEQNENVILSLDELEELEDMNHRTPMAASTPRKPRRKTSTKKVKKKVKAKRVTKKAKKKLQARVTGGMYLLSFFQLLTGYLRNLILKKV